MIIKIINAINLHNGGGKTYLYLLHPFLENNENLLILDYRFKKNHIHFKKAKVIFLKKGLLRNFKIFIIRCFFYFRYYSTNKKNHTNLEKFVEIYLNGIPPFIRFENSQVYLFIQNRLLFENLIPIFKNLHFLKLKLYLLIQKYLQNLFLRDSDLVIVQTNSMFKLVSKYLNNKILLQEEIWGNFNWRIFDNLKKILNKPDENLMKNIKYISSNNILFFFPASFHQHKNHLKLIEAFNILNKKSSLSFKLLLTLNSYEFNNVKTLDSTHIIFLGNLDYHNVIHLYDYIDYLVYPSLNESYGLPLIEASLNDVKVIASDLDYVYDVCDPYLTFNPLSVYDISLKLNIALNHN